MTQHNRSTRRRLAGAGTVGVLGGTFALALTGVALSAPAHAETTLVYNCTTAIGPKDLTVKIDTTAPAEAGVGTVTIPSVKGTVVLPTDISNALAGFLDYGHMEGTTPQTSTVTGPGGSDAGSLAATLTTPKTLVHDAGGFNAGDHIELPVAANTPASFTADAPGDYTINAPAAFKSTFYGYKKAQGGNVKDPNPNVVDCTYKSGNKVIDTIKVTAGGPTGEPTTPVPTGEPTTPVPTGEPTTPVPTGEPTTPVPTGEPTTPAPTGEPTTPAPTGTVTGPPVETDFVNDGGNNNTAVAVGLLTMGGVVGAGYVARRRFKG